MPNGEEKRLNFTPKFWDSATQSYRPFYIAPDATDLIQGDVKLSDAIDSTLNASTGMTAATPYAVKKVSESVSSKLDKVSGDDQTVNSKVTFNNSVVFSKGATISSGQVLIGNVQGNASTATTLQTSRNIVLQGRITGSASFNGGADATISTTIPAGSITATDLGTNAVTTEKILNAAVTADKVSFNYAGSSSKGGSATNALQLKPTTLTNEDLNNLKQEFGSYFAAGGNTCTNKPLGVNNFGLVSWKIASGHYGQLLQTNGDLYIRFFNASSWNEWVRVGYVEDGSITTEKLADGAVTSAKILDGTITNDDIAFNYASSSSKGGIADSALKLSSAKTITFTNEVTGAGSFDGSTNINISLTIGDNTITTNKLSDSSVTSAKIVDGTIVNGDIANTTITGGKLVNGTITTLQLADNSVTSAKIVDGTITNADLSGDVGTIYIGEEEPPEEDSIKLWVKP